MDARFKPMLCEPADAMPEDTTGWVLEPKFDGWRAIVHIGPLLPKTVTVYGGRNGKTYCGKVPYIEQALSDALPADTVIDGELIAPGGWGSVQSVMSSTGAHVPTAISPALTLVVFDVLQINGNDTRALAREVRRDILEMVPWPENTALTPVGPASIEAHIRMLDLGMEGSVIKRNDSPYVNRRSPNWTKLKAIASEDAKITGVEPGKGASNGSVAGAFVVVLPTGVETTIKVPNDKMVAEVTADASKFIGRMVEITHNGVMASGKLRHPRFKRMRDDRDPAPAPASAPAAPRRPRRPSGPKMRAYNLMGEAKLRAAIRDLERGYGEHFDKVAEHAGTPDEHLAAARAAARKKGIAV